MYNDQNCSYQTNKKIEMIGFEFQILGLNR